MVAVPQIAAIPQLSRLQRLTYEQYMTEGEMHARYDIVDGERRLMTKPTRRHQKIVFRFGRHLDDYGQAQKIGEMIIAPCDVLISQSPLRTRQPDVLFIGKERLAQCGNENDPAPLTVAPELVIEVLSNTEYRGIREAKVRDYCTVGVLECWMVSPEAETVETLRLSVDGAETVVIYGVRQTLQCLTFPDLTIPLADIFAA